MTNKQRLFADEYLIDLNATRAYKAIYKAIKNDDVAAQAGSRLLRNVKVSEYIQQRMKIREQRTEITQDKVLNELAKIAFANGTDFAKVVTKPRKRMILNQDTQEHEEIEREEQFVELIDTDTLAEDKKAAISNIKETKFGISVESFDKVKALELIGRHLNMFTDSLKIDGNLVVFKGEDNLED